MREAWNPTVIIDRCLRAPYIYILLWGSVSYTVTLSFVALLDVTRVASLVEAGSLSPYDTCVSL